MVGWANGEPNAPFAALWESGAHVSRVILTADALQLGDPSATEHPLHGETFTSDLSDALTDILADLTTLFAALSLGAPSAIVSIGKCEAQIAAKAYLSTKVTTS